MCAFINNTDSWKPVQDFKNIVNMVQRLAYNYILSNNLWYWIVQICQSSFYPFKYQEIIFNDTFKGKQ